MAELNNRVSGQNKGKNAQSSGENKGKSDAVGPGHKDAKEKQAKLVEDAPAEDDFVAGHREEREAVGMTGPGTPTAGTMSEHKATMTREIAVERTVFLPTAVETLATTLSNGRTIAASNRHRCAEGEVAAVRGILITERREQREERAKVHVLRVPVHNIIQELERDAARSRQPRGKQETQLAARLVNVVKCNAIWDSATTD
ncbi:hypothetical protein DVH05_003218 [Phytophthora capsici]|nr:hypothetical protein DVH05_003218 [Phytophthora capsici]